MEEDLALLIGLCTHRLSAYAEAAGAVSDEERVETLLCLTSLRPLLRGASSAPSPTAALPAQSFMRLVSLVRAVSECPHVSYDVLLATSTLAHDVCAAAAPYVQPPVATPAQATALLTPLCALAAAPMMRACPQLQATPPTLGLGRPSPPAPLPESISMIASSLRSTAALPRALPSDEARLGWLPAPLMLSLQVAHIAAASSVEALAEPALEAVRSLLDLLPAAGGGSGAAVAEAASLVARSATETALALASSVPAAARLPLVNCLLACAAAMSPTDGSCATTAAKVHAHLEELHLTSYISHLTSYILHLTSYILHLTGARATRGAAGRRHR